MSDFESPRFRGSDAPQEAEPKHQDECKPNPIESGAKKGLGRTEMKQKEKNDQQTASAILRKIENAEPERKEKIIKKSTQEISEITGRERGYAIQDLDVLLREVADQEVHLQWMEDKTKHIPAAELDFAGICNAINAREREDLSARRLFIRNLQAMLRLPSNDGRQPTNISSVTSNSEDFQPIPVASSLSPKEYKDHILFAEEFIASMQETRQSLVRIEDHISHTDTRNPQYQNAKLLCTRSRITAIDRCTDTLRKTEIPKLEAKTAGAKDRPSEKSDGTKEKKNISPETLEGKIASLNERNQAVGQNLKKERIHSHAADKISERSYEMYKGEPCFVLHTDVDFTKPSNRACFTAIFQSMTAFRGEPVPKYEITPNKIYVFETLDGIERRVQDTERKWGMGEIKETEEDIKKFNGSVRRSPAGIAHNENFVQMPSENQQLDSIMNECPPMKKVAWGRLVSKGRFEQATSDGQKKMYFRVPTSRAAEFRQCGAFIFPEQFKEKTEIATNGGYLLQLTVPEVENVLFRLESFVTKDFWKYLAGDPKTRDWCKKHNFTKTSLKKLGEGVITDDLATSIKSMEGGSDVSNLNPKELKQIILTNATVQNALDAPKL